MTINASHATITFAPLTHSAPPFILAMLYPLHLQPYLYDEETVQGFTTKNAQASFSVLKYIFSTETVSKEKTKVYLTIKAEVLDTGHPADITTGTLKQIKTAANSQKGSVKMKK